MSAIQRPSVSPQWATDENYIAGSGDWNGLPNKVQPPTGTVGQGFTPEDYVPAEFVNFELWNHGQWLAYIDSILGFAFFGDGSDGVAVADGTNAIAGATLSGGAYFLNRDVFYSDFTLSVRMRTNGFRVYVQDTATITTTGVLGYGGNDGGNASTTSSTATVGVGGAALSGGTLGGAAAGGNGSAPFSGAGVGTVGSNSTTSYGGNGGGGGTLHSTFTGSYGTSGGVASAPSAVFGSARDLVGALTVSAIGDGGITPIAGGAGGSGGSAFCTGSPENSVASGGGGGGGGPLALFARNLILAGSAQIESVGGNGGNGSVYETVTDIALGGGGGGGGFITLMVFALFVDIGKTINDYVSVAGGNPGATSGTGTGGGGTSTQTITTPSAAGAPGTLRATIIGSSSFTSGLPVVHDEGGVVTFGTGGTGQGFDYYDVTFDAEYTDTSYKPQLTVIGGDDTSGVPGCSARLLTTTGFRIRPDAQFVGSISWSTKL